MIPLLLILCLEISSCTAKPVVSEQDHLRLVLFSVLEGYNILSMFLMADLSCGEIFLKLINKWRMVVQVDKRVGITEIIVGGFMNAYQDRSGDRGG